MDIKSYLLELGYTDSEAVEMAADPKTQKALNGAVNRYEEGTRAKSEAESMRQQTTQQKQELDKWWKDTAQPAILAADGGGAQAKAEAAQYKAYITDLKEKGYPVPDNWVSNPTPAVVAQTMTTPAYDPQKAAMEFANATTLMFDLDSEYQTLFGERLPNANGLLREAQQNGKPLTDYVRSKFNFDSKKQEMNTKRETDRVERITKDITEKLEAKYAERSNPNLAPAVVSKAAQVVERQGEHAESWRTKKTRHEAKKDRLIEFRNVLKTA